MPSTNDALEDARAGTQLRQADALPPDDDAELEGSNARETQSLSSPQSNG